MSEDAPQFPPAGEQPPEQEAEPEAVPVADTVDPEQAVVPQQVEQPADDTTEVTGDIAAPVPEGWEPDPNRAHYMADADKELRMAASMAEQVGRTEKAEELRQSADMEAQKGAEEFDRDQQREAERRLNKLRIEEDRRRAKQERLQRLGAEVNALIDNALEAVNLKPGQREELLDDIEWDPGYGSEPKIAAFYERLQLPRPNEETVPDYDWDTTKEGPSHVVGSRQVTKMKTFQIPTKFGVLVTETRYQPRDSRESKRVRLTVEKEPVTK